MAEGDLRAGYPKGGSVSGHAHKDQSKAGALRHCEKNHSRFNGAGFSSFGSATFISQHGFYLLNQVVWLERLSNYRFHTQFTDLLPIDIV